MDIEYLRTSRKSYMLVKHANYVFESYELQMILHNDIPNLLDFQVIIGDGEVEYWYDVTGMQSLEKQFSVSLVGEIQLRFFLRNLISIKNVMEDYLLNEQNISFLSSMIFYDRFTNRIRFCYIPGLAEQNPPALKELFGEILQYLDHSDTGAVRMGYAMYERCMKAEFLVEDCMDCLANHEEESSVKESFIEKTAESFYVPHEGQQEILPDSKYNLYNRQDSAEVRYQGKKEIRHQNIDAKEIKDQMPEYVDCETENHKGFWKKRRKNKKRRDYSYSDFLDEEQRKFYAAEEIQNRQYTECFSEENLENAWTLIYKGEGLEETWALSSFPFFVGTDSKKVQGCMRARTISRIHAKFYLIDERLFLEDYNSTNGTYVNHKMIPMNTPVELQPGDRVVFATEEYMVSCIKLPKR